MTRARSGLIFLVLVATALGSACTAARSETPSPVDRVVLVIQASVSLEQLLDAPIYADLARAGGAALMTTAESAGAGMDAMARTLDTAGITTCSDTDPRLAGRIDTNPSSPIAELTEAGAMEPCPDGSVPGRRLIVLEATSGPAVERTIAAAAEGGTEPLGVLVVSPSTSRDMDRRGDQVPPLIEAVGSQEELFGTGGPLGTLTSNTTRRDGLVASIDVGPTVLALFGEPVPSTMAGSPIRFADGPAPLDLHRRYLEYRRIRSPLSAALLVFVSVMFVASVVVFALQWSGRDVPRPADRVLRFLLLFGVALPTALAAGGLLPRFTAAVVWPFVVLLPAALAAVARRVPGGPMTPFTFLGVVGLAFLAVDAIVLGGRALEIPLVGGTIFDGVRFYGLPNALLALVLASTLFVAAPLGPGRGFALLVGVGLVLGAPWVGADLGGAVTMFAAAGLWWPLTTGTEFRWRGVAIAVGTVVVGTAVVLLVNRYLPGAPTHVTRFVEGTGLNPARVLGRFGDRLSVGFGQVADVPWVLLALAGLVAVLWLAIARAGPVGRGLAAVDGHWRSVLVALTAAGLVAFVANDTGAAAAAPVFLYAVGCVTYPALLAPDAERRSVPGSVGDE